MVRLAEDQRTVKQFRNPADAVDDLYLRLAGADFAVATANELETAAETSAPSSHI